MSRRTADFASQGGSIRVSEETRQRITLAAKELGYVADPLAVSIAGGRRNLIGVFTYEALFPVEHRDFYHPFLVGIEEEAERSGFDLVLFTRTRDAAGRRRVYRDGVNHLRLADGAILLGADPDRAELERLQDEDYPFVYTSRIQGLRSTEPFELSQAEAIGRQQCVEIFQFLRRYCPGFENCVRMDTSSQVGVRESRHVTGLYTLTSKDLMDERRFEDVIALGGYPIDIHSPTEGDTNTTHLRPDIAYGIPMRCLLVETPENLVVSGRAISATHDAAAAFRVTPIAMAIGQAAGTIAAVATRARVSPNRLNSAQVRPILLKNGAYLDHVRF